MQGLLSPAGNPLYLLPADLVLNSGRLVPEIGLPLRSRREGIIFAGNADRIDEELKEIKEEQATKNAEIRQKEQKIASSSEK